MNGEQTQSKVERSNGEKIAAPVQSIVRQFPVDVVICGDSLDVMEGWPDKCVDAVITDMPYGTTQNEWDRVPDLPRFWSIAWRVCRGVVVTTASQPFTSELVMSQRAAFKHEWIWQKNRGSNFANTVREPMKEHESVLVFARGPWTYNPQRQPRNGSGKDRVRYGFTQSTESANYGKLKRDGQWEYGEDRVPSSVQLFNTETGLHTTQKPQKLFEYLVLTYTNEGDIVCDPFGGSGTTAAAAQNTGRRYVSIEGRDDYCQTQRQRLAQRVMF